MYVQANLVTESDSFSFFTPTVRFLPACVCLSLYLSVCLSLSVIFARYMKNRCSRLDTEMFQHMSWKPFYLEVKRSRSRVTVTRYNNSAGVCFGTFVTAGFYLCIQLFSAYKKSFCCIFMSHPHKKALNIAVKIHL